MDGCDRISLAVAVLFAVGGYASGVSAAAEQAAPAAKVQQAFPRVVSFAVDGVVLEEKGATPPLGEGLHEVVITFDQGIVSLDDQGDPEIEGVEIYTCPSLDDQITGFAAS